ncbi:MAG: phosphoesterase [Pirellulaceae bacterium]
MSVSTGEHVLVIPTATFHEAGLFQGFSDQVSHYVPKLFAVEQLSYKPRDLMERSPEFKQLIPYVIFEHTDAEGNRTVFQYTRGSGQGETRLHSKRSVGVGGHVSAEDGHFTGDGNPFEQGMRRELEEEVAIDTQYELQCVGLINDDSNEVGQVHLGVVHLCKVQSPNVTPREIDLANAGFQPVEQLLKELDQFETWSSICLEAIYR